MRSRLFLCLWIILSAIAGVNAQGLGECGTGVPAPVVDYYLGKISADAVRAAASKGDAQTQAAQQCEAEFYLGEFVLAQAVGKIDPSGIKPDQPDQNLNALDPEAVRQAKPMLARAAEICPAGFTERMGALGELKRMQ